MKTKISLMSDPEYKAAYEKLQSLNGELEATGRKIDRLHGKLQDDDFPDPLDEEAQRYLSGTEKGYVPNPQNTARNQVLELYHKRSVIRRAIEVQRKKLTELRCRVSESICRSVRPDYAKIVKRQCELIKQIAGVMDEERELREAMEDADLAWSSHIPPMVLFGIGSLKEENSFASRFIQEAKEHEYI